MCPTIASKHQLQFKYFQWGVGECAVWNQLSNNFSPNKKNVEKVEEPELITSDFRRSLQYQSQDLIMLLPEEWAEEDHEVEFSLGPLSCLWSKI